MKVLTNERYVDLDFGQFLSKGIIADFEVKEIERVVSRFYDTSIYELNTFSTDSDAKLMTCFLQHHLLKISIGKLAYNYNIYHGYLRTKLIELYQRCLTDSDFMIEVQTLKNEIIKDVIQKEAFNSETAVCT